jgi:hypothetical protein
MDTMHGPYHSSRVVSLEGSDRLPYNLVRKPPSILAIIACRPARLAPEPWCGTAHLQPTVHVAAKEGIRDIDTLHATPLESLDCRCAWRGGTGAD